MIADIKDAILTSEYKIDQILGVYSGSLTIAGTGGIGSPALYTIVGNPAGETCFIRGIISFDGGLSWQDASWEGKIPVSPNQNAFMFPAVSSTIVAYIAGNAGAAFNIQYQLFLYAKPSQSPQNYPTTYPANGIIFDSKYNYQKIAFDIATASLTLNHNLGYIPKVSVFEDFSLFSQVFVGPYTSNQPLLVDQNTVTIESGFGGDTTNWFRVYYD